MITNADLNKWAAAIALDLQVLQAEMWGAGSLPSGDFAEELRFLNSVDEAAMSKVAERAVAMRIETGDWPRDLNHGEYRHLWHRALNARWGLLPVAAAEDALPSDILRLTPFTCPDPADAAAMVRWLFLDLWDATHADYRQHLSVGAAD